MNYSSDECFEKVSDGLYRCRRCGEIVQSGIAKISGHWANCDGKDFVKDLQDNYAAVMLSIGKPIRASKD